MEGRWEIRDLYYFPHRYAEVYSFLYALAAADWPQRSSFVAAFNRYPWRGGYSAVNFYDDLYEAIPRDQRPKIVRIEYASPGYIELGAVIVLVTQIDRILTTAMKTWDKLDKIYEGIHKRAMDRRLLRITLKEREQELTKDDVRFTIEACRELSAAIGLDDPEAINKLTGDPLSSLKIIMAFFRRIRELVFYVQDGKVRITHTEKNLLDDDPLNKKPGA